MIADKVWGTKLALIVIDPQRKFTIASPDWESKRDAAVKGINAYTALFREYGMPVVFVRYEGTSHTGYSGDDAEEWLQGIETSPEDVIFTKRNMSCFKQSDFPEVIRNLGADTIILCGMLTEFCVVSTYFTAGEHSFVAYLAKDALLAYGPEGNQAAYTLCNTVDTGVLRTFFDGKQEPFGEMF